MAANSICWKLPSKFSFFSPKYDKKIEIQLYLVEFRRFLSCDSIGFHEVSNSELLHGIVGLYDVCLPDITPEVLYPTVCAKWAKTLILVRSQSDVLSELQEKHGIPTCETENNNEDNQTSIYKQEEAHSISKEAIYLTEKHVRWSDIDSGVDVAVNELNRNIDENVAPSITSQQSEHLGDKQEQGDSIDSDKKDEIRTNTSDSGVSLAERPHEQDKDAEPGMFDGVFSDSEDEQESSEEDEEEEEDFSKGVEDFIAAAKSRRIQRDSGNVSKKTVGIESMVIGAATYERCYSKPKEKVMQLSLLSIKKRYRRCGVGKRIIDTLKDPTFLGPYDSMAVYADHSAVEFFKKNGFTDDVVLNSRFTDLTDHWINSTLMCYLPPFTGSDISGVYRSDFEIKAMEDEMDKWRDKSLDAYQAQMSCMVRMKHEIKTLKAMVDTQDEVIKTLTSAKDRLQKDKFRIEKQLLDYQVKEKDATLYEDSDEEADFYESLASILSKQHVDGDAHQLDLGAISQGHFGDVSKEDEDMLTSLINSQTEKHLIQQVRRSLMNTKLYSDVNVINIRTVESSHVALLETSFESPTRHGDAATTCHQLYYCGDQLDSIITRGFTKQDFAPGLYGKGLYFTAQPSQAARFSVAGKLLLVNVRLGITDFTARHHRNRVLPPAGFDSILTPGRPTSPLLYTSQSQEYVVFDPMQAIPVYLIEYSTTSK